MATDDNKFEPRLGRMRATHGTRGRTYLARVLAASNLARGAGTLVGSGKRDFAGGRYGRASGIGRLLARRDPRGHLRGRRVVVKARFVRLAGKGAAAAAAHLRYLQRDGTTRDGAPGVLYGSEVDQADARAFRERGQGDRHQFRFIVSAEDGADYDDLRPLTRRLMDQVEADLGTRLDWVAVDHFNTGHPHTHIVVRGIDDRGRDLVIARDYLSNGLRERARELVELDLGPRTDRAIEDALRRDVDAERLTSIDRDLLRGADGQLVTAKGRDAFDHAIRTGRLAKLARLGLAERLSEGRFRLAPDLIETLRAMGERGDIIKTLHRTLAEHGLRRGADELGIFQPEGQQAVPLVGRVLARGLADEHADRHYLIVDGVDGRSHHVAIGKGEATEPIGPDAIVRVVPASAEVREVDRTILAVATANGGTYDVDTHLRHDPAASQSFAEAHVRRLEAMRRAGIPLERAPSGKWTIAPDHLKRVAGYERRRLLDCPVTIEVLSPKGLEALIEADAPTWLDRELIGTRPEPLRSAGFGREVEVAKQRRQQWLIEQELAAEAALGVTYRSDLTEVLRRRELLRVAEQLSDELGWRFVEPPEGAPIDGVLRRRVELLGGRMALIEKAREFSLVPWRPVFERQLGKHISGIMRSSGTSWAFDRGRSGPHVT